MMTTHANPQSEEFAALIGLDWGNTQHALALLDCRSGQTQTATLPHSVQSIHSWLAEMEQRFGSRPVALAIETSKGPLINMFLDVPWLTVFPIHPATSARIRKAFAPSGAKDDVPDAQVLLMILTHHRAKLHPLFVDDPATRQLGALCELRRRSVDQRTKLVVRLGSVLKSYFPQALELVGNLLYSPMALEFLKRWPDLLSLKTSRPSTVQSFYYRHNVRSQTLVQARLQQIAQAKALTTDPAIVFVAQRLVQRLVEQLTHLQKHILEDEKLIAEAFAKHPDAELFRDLPGAGRTLAPRLLLALGTDRTRFADASALQRYSGVAPVKEKSGGRVWVHWRWNAPWFLRQTFVEWAGQTTRYCPWSKAYYERQRKKGKHHWSIMRSLAFIWIRILFKCWKTRTPYNQTRYLESLRKHRSPLLQPA